MKVALVTGAARRIGAAIARHLHEHDWNVIIHCNHSTAEAESLAGELNMTRNNSAIVIRASLANADAPGILADAAIAAWGQVDLLVNNASQFYPTTLSSPLSDTSAAAFDDVMHTNARAPLLLSTALARHLSGGSIINIIDIHGEKPLRDYIIYSMSKAALVMMTKALAVELAPGIRVNGVSPGAILWPENDGEMSDKAKAELLSAIPMGRLGSERDIARAVRFLAEEAPFITGQILDADGGQSAT